MASLLNRGTEFETSYRLCIGKVADVSAGDKWRVLFLGNNLTDRDEGTILDTPIGSARVEWVIRSEYGGKISFPILGNKTINGDCVFAMRELAEMLKQRHSTREGSPVGTLLMLGQNSSGKFPEDSLVYQHMNLVKLMAGFLEPKNMAALGMLFLRKQGQRVDFYK